ncbi:glycosyltransferase [Brumimicrobium glaciale]|uniref:Glycosyltransferase n=1 Tax=Brumimicrobium glaciale TaxID=200475 RepID=A0A4Q4KKX5_9FLAO|nr:glycosyltransferase [Brumimicrobium glaciale]RYM33550.1 glycosyltransferase [Brumimicrobium glaciale]
MLSILIPVYNFDCVALVKALHSQCMELNIAFEVLVLDDTSTQFKEENRAINEFEHCQYIESNIHYGRAKIRNELGKRAQFENLLFIDSDALVNRPDFIENYTINKDNAQVIIGGMKYSVTPPKENALRWHYGSQREFLPAEIRNKTPYKSLISFNIMLKKSVLDKHPFDEGTIDIEKSGYGHEDTLLGLELKKNNISVLHIDNQLVHDYLETNEGFIANSLTAVEKYVFNPQFQEKEIVEQIKIFRVFEKMRSFRMVGVLSFIYNNFGSLMKSNLFKSNPSIRLFDFYRLSYLANYYKKNRG